MSNPLLAYFPQEIIGHCSQVCDQLYDKRCCNQLIRNLSINDETCLKLFLIKTLGYGIIVLGSIVKLPQVLKILNAKSGVGISLFGVMLELLAITFNASYSYRKGFPLSVWGECIALALETAFIIHLVLQYDNRKFSAWLFLLGWIGILYVLNHPSLVSMNIIWYLQSSVIYLAVSGKLMQAFKNYKAQHTGQLSAISAWAIFAGSLARILTTIQETGDMLTTVSFIFSSCANGVIASQVLWYWQSTKKFLEKGKKKKTN